MSDNNEQREDNDGFQDTPNQGGAGGKGNNRKNKKAKKNAAAAAGDAEAQAAEDARIEAAVALKRK